MRLSSFGRIEHGSPALGHRGESGLVSGFQRQHDAAVGFQKERHVRQHLADGEGFDLGPGGEFALVGDESQPLPGGQLESVVFDLAPDRGVNPVRVAGTGRKRVYSRLLGSMKWAGIGGAFNSPAPHPKP